MPIYPGNILTATAAPVSAIPTSTRTWQWLRSGVAIPTATGLTYTITNADIDTMLSVQQIETNFLGLTSASSAQTEAVSTPAPTPAILFALAEPGVWYDPSDVANLDWRRNLILWSEQFDINTAWNKATGLTITANAIAAPDGTMTADKFVETALNVGHAVVPPTAAIAYVAGQSYTVSAYFKAGERNWVNLQLPSAPFGSSKRSWFNLATGVLGTTASGATSVITSVGNGWYRCSLSAPCVVTNAPSPGAVWAISDADAVQVYLGDGVSGAYCWGAQVEVGTEPSAYQRITDLNTEIIALFPAATMYQDTNGIAPVTTPGQPVGLRLDKSKALALGAELVANGDFSSGSTGWTTGATTVISAGMANSTATGTGINIIQQAALSPPANKLYQVKFDVTNWTAGDLRVFINNTNVIVTGGNKSYSVFIVNTEATPSGGLFIRAQNSSFTGSIDNVSVREVPGNHAFQTVAGSRLTYGIEPKTGTRNILTFTEQIDNAIWSRVNLLAFGSGSTANAIAAPDATITADLLTPTTSTLGSGASQSYNNTVSQAHTLSFSVKANGTDFVQLLWHNTLSTDYANFNITTGAVTAGTYTAATITDQGNGWFRCTITSTLAVASNVVSLYIIPTATSSRGAAYTGDGIKGVYVWGAQLERGAAVTTYQRVTTAFDVAEAGVPSCHYCQYDGTDDSMSTVAIDFTSTDAMSVFAGVFKRADPTLGTILEFGPDSVNTNGSFSLRAPSLAYSYLARGTAIASATTTTTYPSPRYNLLSGYNDISADQAVLRINGVQAVTSSNDQGTGNFGTQPLYIGRRNNVSFAFSGRDYGLIVVGKTVSAGDLASTETWLAGKTPGVTL